MAALNMKGVLDMIDSLATQKSDSDRHAFYTSLLESVAERAVRWVSLNMEIDAANDQQTFEKCTVAIDLADQVASVLDGARARLSEFRAATSTRKSASEVVLRKLLGVAHDEKTEDLIVSTMPASIPKPAPAKKAAPRLRYYGTLVKEVPLLFTHETHNGREYRFLYVGRDRYTAGPSAFVSNSKHKVVRCNNKACGGAKCTFYHDPQDRPDTPDVCRNIYVPWVTSMLEGPLENGDSISRAFKSGKLGSDQIMDIAAITGGFFSRLLMLRSLQNEAPA